MKKIENGDTVKVNYTGKLEDGTIFDTSLSEGRTPLESTLGQGSLIPGFENGLIGMTIGETKTIEIEPSQAYGQFREEMVADVPKNSFPPDVIVGQQFMMNTEQGPFPIRVVEVSEEFVRIDGNHPLAGKKLIFELEVVEIA